MHQLDQGPDLRDQYYLNNIKSGGLNGEKAIISLYTQYHKSVKNIVSEIIALYPGCRTEPDDIAHDAFLVMIHKIQFESATSRSLKAFWIGIARKLIRNHVKKLNRITLVEELDEDYGEPEISPETLFMITEENQQFENFLSKSGSRCKDILLMWIAQYNMDEIAKQLNISGATVVRKMKSACFKQLKILIRKNNLFNLRADEQS